MGLSKAWGYEMVGRIDVFEEILDLAQGLSERQIHLLAERIEGLTLEHPAPPEALSQQCDPVEPPALGVNELFLELSHRVGGSGQLGH